MTKWIELREKIRKIYGKHNRLILAVVKFVLALFLFLGFLGMRQTDFSWHSWNAEKITQQIQSSIKFPQILEVLNRL